MPSVSADNLRISQATADLREQYKAFTTGLRGLTGEILTGLSNGTKSFLSMSRELEAFSALQTRTMIERSEYALRDAAQSALVASEKATSAMPNESAYAASDALVAGFIESVSGAIETQAKKDVQAAEMFLRKQLTQGRFFATTKELSMELVFKHRDRSGREIDSDEYAFRELNWSLRQHYNTVLMFACSGNGHDVFVVDGGSKAGTAVSLDDYDKLSGAIFHHNSKALLQPTNYSVS